MKPLIIFTIYLLAIINILSAQQIHTHSDNHQQHTPAHDDTQQTHSHVTSSNTNHDHSAHDHNTHSQEEATHDHQHEHHKDHLSTMIIKPTTYIKTIKTTGVIKVNPTSELVITAKTSGILNYNQSTIVTGKEVTKGKPLFTISGDAMVDNNINVKFNAAKNAFQQSKEHYQRAKILIQDKIISRQDFLSRKAIYEKDSLNYQLLKNNFASRQLRIKAPKTGEIFNLFVKNGAYVQSGQKLAIITQTCHNYLSVNLPKKYYHKRHHINSGNFKMEYSQQVNYFQSTANIANSGRLVEGSPFIPLHFSLGHTHDLIPGSFAEVWLNIDKIDDTIVVPKKALIEQQGLYFVFVKKGPDDYLKTAVKVGSMNVYEAQIDDGLHTGDEVVVEGALELKLTQSGGAIDPHAGHSH